MDSKQEKPKADWELAFERRVAENREKALREQEEKKAARDAESARRAEIIAKSQRVLEESKVTMEKSKSTVTICEETQQHIEEMDQRFVDFGEKVDNLMNSAFEIKLVISHILGNVYLGNLDAAKDLKLLRQHNISQIISVVDLPPAFPDEFVYLVLKIEESLEVNIWTTAKAAAQRIQECDGNVLVH